jgi:hypothetical protein
MRLSTKDAIAVPVTMTLVYAFSVKQAARALRQWLVTMSNAAE